MRGGGALRLQAKDATARLLNSGARGRHLDAQPFAEGDRSAWPGGGIDRTADALLEQQARVTVLEGKEPEPGTQLAERWREERGVHPPEVRVDVVAVLLPPGGPATLTHYPAAF